MVSPNLAALPGNVLERIARRGRRPARRVVEGGAHRAAVAPTASAASPAPRRGEEGPARVTTPVADVAARLAPVEGRTVDAAEEVMRRPARRTLARGLYGRAFFFDLRGLAGSGVVAAMIVGARPGSDAGP